MGADALLTFRRKGVGTLLLVTLGLAAMILPPLVTEFRRDASAEIGAEDFEWWPFPEAESSKSGEPIQPLPRTAKLNAAKAALGGKLFRDPLLAGNGQQACTACHQLDHGGADHLAHSIGLGGKKTGMNVPTIFNVALNFKANWEGNFDMLSTHLDKLIENPVVVGTNWTDVVSKLNSASGYPAQFKAIFKDGITKANVISAMVEFETSLITPDSRFDRYLRGDELAITPQEAEGYKLFRGLGCVSCHQGMNIGGNMFQKFGVMGDYFVSSAAISKADLGRFAVTGAEEDRHVFRVPSLRNVAVTGPYFHDGSAPTLDMAVAIMGRYQLGRTLQAGEIEKITAFLGTLTGEYQGRLLRE